MTLIRRAARDAPRRHFAAMMPPRLPAAFALMIITADIYFFARHFAAALRRLFSLLPLKCLHAVVTALLMLRFAAAYTLNTSPFRRHYFQSFAILLEVENEHAYFATPPDIARLLMLRHATLL